MDNPEYTFQVLEGFSKIKTKEIPGELEEYISYVARTGDPVFQWSLVKVLIKEKLLAVLNEFKENNPSLEIPPCPNVDPFNYEVMKTNLLSRLDSFILPPFTIQRICELLSSPRKEYNRIDKYMRAVEKNVLVVSACELSLKRGLDGDGNESMVNGMLYDKVNDSMNNFSNHVFSTSHENVDELHLSGKLDVPENDTVQQILDETWTAEAGDGDDFKINESNNSTSLSVSFDNELQFVADKSTQKINVDGDTEPKPIEQSSSFGENDSLLMESSLQNIIVDNANISYDDTMKSTSDLSSDTNTSAECKDVIFSFSQSQSSENANADDNAPDTSIKEPSDEPEKSFDESSTQQQNISEQEPVLDTNLSCTSNESFSQASKDISIELEDQYKPETSFEYGDFSSQESKSDSTLEYSFEPEQKSQSSSDYANDEMTVDGKSETSPKDSASSVSAENIESSQDEKPDKSSCSIITPQDDVALSNDSKDVEPTNTHDLHDEQSAGSSSEKSQIPQNP